jgi:hypothetical protein
MEDLGLLIYHYRVGYWYVRPPYPERRRILLLRASFNRSSR